MYNISNETNIFNKKADEIIGIVQQSKTNYYHTSKDIVENIEPKAIETVMNIIINYIYFTDNTVL